MTIKLQIVTKQSIQQLVIISLLRDQIVLLKGREMVSDWIKTKAYTD